jgi:large subunit ribosomal protein L28
MSRVCALSGKKTHAGRQYTMRGLAKAKGGVGKKTTGKTNRTFKPNVQRVRAIVGGKKVRLKVAAKFLRRGMVTKAPVRNWSPGDASSAAPTA